MRTLVSALVMMFTLTTAVPRAAAQTAHTAPQSAIDAALQQQVGATAADRETVLRLLERTEVKELAGQVGLDLRQAQSAVAALDGQELATLAAQARQAEAGLAGGQSSVTISTTMIIIGLLVLIVLILALN
jgi:hypothetical protein